MGDVTRTAPGSLGRRANESAVGGGRLRARRMQECSLSRLGQNSAGSSTRVPPGNWPAAAKHCHPGFLQGHELGGHSLRFCATQLLV